MAQITTEELDIARGHIRAGNLDALMDWIYGKGVFIDGHLFYGAMSKIILVDPERAVQLFDKTFAGMDPEADRKKAVTYLAIRVAMFLVVVLGCIGGIVYLFKVPFP